MNDLKANCKNSGAEFVCYCNKVTKNDIIEAIQAKGAKTVAEVIRITGAMQNSNCAVNNPKRTCCYADIVHVFNTYRGEINE